MFRERSGSMPWRVFRADYPDIVRRDRGDGRAVNWREARGDGDQPHLLPTGAIPPLDQPSHHPYVIGGVCRYRVEDRFPFRKAFGLEGPRLAVPVLHELC